MRSGLQIVETFARKPRVFYDVAARSWAVHSAYLVQYHGDDRERAIRVAESIAPARCVRRRGL